MTIYNPHLVPRQELLETFVARLPLLEELVDDVRRGGGQHHLVAGDRGTGKTTLLLRLAIAIEDDARLAKTAVPLRFPEEQYNVASLADFWMNAIDALVDALERRSELDVAKELEAQLTAIESLPLAERAPRAVSMLEAWAKKSKRLVIMLVDNFDLVLDRVRDDHWALRETLSADNGLVVIAASSRMMDDVIAYEAPFYDFFKLHQLGPLSEEDARSLILAAARREGAKHIEETLDSDPGRFKALFLLTGGTPRTLRLLSWVLAHGQGEDGIERDLDRLLDQVTPYYKARFDDLPSQSQIVVDAVALHWNPITAAECAERTSLGKNVVSAQLDRLTKSGVLAKVALPGAAKLGFQLTERFFNIWYLMRASRRLRSKLTWFVEFLRAFYGEEELERRAQALLDEAGLTDKDPARLLAFASTVKAQALRRRLELRATISLVARDHRPAELRELLALEGEDAHLAPVIDRARAVREMKARILKDSVLPEGVSKEQFANAFAGFVLYSTSRKRALLAELRSDWRANADAVRLIIEAADFVGPRLTDAVANGIVCTFEEVMSVADLNDLLDYSPDPFKTIVGVLERQLELGVLPSDALLEAMRDADEFGYLALLYSAGELLDEGHRVEWAFRLARLACATGQLDMLLGSMFFRFCVKALRYRRASELVDIVGPLGENGALPIREGILAFEDPSRLSRLAPELRSIANEVVDKLRHALPPSSPSDFRSVDASPNHALGQNRRKPSGYNVTPREPSMLAAEPGRMPRGARSRATNPDLAARAAPAPRHAGPSSRIKPGSRRARNPTGNRKRREG